MPDTPAQAGEFETSIRRWPSRQNRSLPLSRIGLGAPSWGTPAVMKSPASRVARQRLMLDRPPIDQPLPSGPAPPWLE